MYNAAIYRRITDRLTALGKTANAVCIAAGLGRDVIRDIHRKPKILPRIDTLATLAVELGTTPEWLAFGRGAEDPAALQASVRAIPLVSWVAASAFAAADVSAAPGEEWPTVEVAGLPAGDYFALTVQGDSMNRIAVHHSTIIVRRTDRTLVDRGFYVFVSEEGSTFKRYRAKDGPPRLEPYSTNSAHETIFPNGEVRVVGRVARVITDLYSPSVSRSPT
ncbi:S24 family peptidase [Aquabacter sp. L1I39]|uniref:S24 family peptidase n=1 Tax=Aquabacter sp. L1I39 TaxID=2820278 RepID=UPI001AD9F322|nr:S24 family peptidase [Aquabacter sp. L1I39]QTL01935.1 S24 family peptidase [Aquabacter sp. L1I39]